MRIFMCPPCLQVDELDLPRMGPLFEHNAVFPARTNTGTRQRWQLGAAGGGMRVAACLGTLGEMQVERSSRGAASARAALASAGWLCAYAGIPLVRSALPRSCPGGGTPPSET